MIEVLLAVLWTATGALAGRVARLPGPAALAAAFPVGAAIHMLLGTLVAAAALSAPVGIVTTASLAVGLALASTLGRRDGWEHVVATVGVAAVLAVVGAAIGLAVVPTITADSYRYLLTAGLLSEPAGLVEGGSRLLQKRMSGLPLLHAPAVPGPGYSSAVGPLAALSILVGLWSHQPRGRDVALPLAATAALVTIDRFVFHARYLNGHLLLAALLLAVFVVERRRAPGDVPTVIVQGLLLAGVVLVRPEGFLTSLLVVAALAAYTHAGRTERVWLLVPMCAATAAWYATIVRVESSVGAAHGVEVLAPLALATALLLATPWLARVRLDDHRVRRLWWGLPWALLVAAALGRPGPLTESAIATARNLWWEGLWGSSLLVLAIIVGVAVATWRGRLRGSVAYVLVTFVPLAGLLVYARDGIYRVGPGDSLTRMLMHLVPLAVAAVVWSADDGRTVSAQAA